MEGDAFGWILHFTVSVNPMVGCLMLGVLIYVCNPNRVIEGCSRPILESGRRFSELTEQQNIRRLMFNP